MTAQNFFDKNKVQDDGWGPVDPKEENYQLSENRPSKLVEGLKAKKWVPFEKLRSTPGNIHQSNLPGKSQASLSRKEELENDEEKEFNDFLRGNQDGFF